MLREHSTIFRRMMIFADLCIVTGAFFLAHYLRCKHETFCPIYELFWFLLLFVALWGILLYFTGMYNSFRLKRMREVLFIIYQSAYLGFFIFAGLCYIFKIYNISRIFVFLSFIFAMLFLVLEKIAIIQFFRYLRIHGHNYRNLLIVGTGERGKSLVKAIDKNKEFGINIIGFVNESDKEIGTILYGHPVLGKLKDLPFICKNNINSNTFIFQLLYKTARWWCKDTRHSRL